ncbi:MAG: hypothetical protein ACLRH0_07245 [Blautia wexlerae]
MESDLLMKNAGDTYAVTAESAKGKCIVDIISTDLGKKCQDEYMEDQIRTYIPIIEKAYGTMPGHRNDGMHQYPAPGRL